MEVSRSPGQDTAVRDLSGNHLWEFFLFTKTGPSGVDVERREREEVEVVKTVGQPAGMGGRSGGPGEVISGESPEGLEGLRFSTILAAAGLTQASRSGETIGSPRRLTSLRFTLQVAAAA